MPKETKATKTEKLKRVQKVMELLATGHRRVHILRWVEEHSKWDVSESMVDQYIAAAYEQFKKAAQVDRDTAYLEAVASMQWAKMKTASVMDYQRFIAASRELHRIQDVYPEETIRIISSMDKPSLDALEKLLAVLKELNKSPGDVFETLMQVYAENANRS